MRRNFFTQLAMIMRSFVPVARTRGVARTAHLALSELWFDPSHGTDTSLEFAEPRGSHSPSHPSHAACNPVIFRELMANVPLRKDASGFLDLGAGKGRALLLAETCGFRWIIGVETDPRLILIAEQNVAGARRRGRGRRGSITVHSGNAARFTIPDTVNVIFLYNPFGPEIIDQVIDRIGESAQQSPRDIFVVYQNARYLDRFVTRGFSPRYSQGVDGSVLAFEAAH